MKKSLNILLLSCLMSYGLKGMEEGIVQKEDGGQEVIKPIAMREFIKDDIGDVLLGPIYEDKIKKERILKKLIHKKDKLANLRLDFHEKPEYKAVPESDKQNMLKLVTLMSNQNDHMMDILLDPNAQEREKNDPIQQAEVTMEHFIKILESTVLHKSILQNEFKEELAQEKMLQQGLLRRGSKLEKLHRYFFEKPEYQKISEEEKKNMLKLVILLKKENKNLEYNLIRLDK